MDRQTMHARYATYFQPIQKLASFTSWEPAGVEKVFESKSLMQKAYSDVREIGFDGRVTDYMAWISTSFMVDRVRSRVSGGTSTFRWARVICEQYETDKVDVINFMRLWGFYDDAYELLDAEIEQREFSNGKNFAYKVERLSDYVRTSAFLAAFQEFLYYYEYEIKGKKTDNLNDRIKIIAEAVEKIEIPQ